METPDAPQPDRPLLPESLVDAIERAIATIQTDLASAQWRASGGKSKATPRGGPLNLVQWQGLGEDLDRAIQSLPAREHARALTWLAPHLSVLAAWRRGRHGDFRSFVPWRMAAHRLLNSQRTPPEDPWHLRRRATWAALYPDGEQDALCAVPGADPVWWNAVIGDPVAPFRVNGVLIALLEADRKARRQRRRPAKAAPSPSAPTPGAEPAAAPSAARPTLATWAPWMLASLEGWREEMSAVWGDRHPQPTILRVLQQLLWDLDGLHALEADTWLQHPTFAPSRRGVLQRVITERRVLHDALRRRLLLDPDRDVRLLAVRSVATASPLGPSERPPARRRGR